MCGIVGMCMAGITKNRQTLGGMLTSALKSLEYRGYDSVGLAILQDYGFSSKIIIRKAKGKVDEVSERMQFYALTGRVGIGHTRWATHGPPNDINAHPHTDCEDKIAVVHNGIIKNFYELKEALSKKGHVFKSDTDTEVIAHLVEDYLRHGEETSFYQAFKKAISRLEGSYAIAVISTYEPGKIFFAKNESPLIIGLGKNSNYIASDIPALLPYTKTVIPLKDGDLGWISPSDIHIDNIRDQRARDWRSLVIKVEWKPEMAKKGGYPHYMIKEIHEQPIAVKSTYEGLLSDNRLILAAEFLNRANKIFVTAAGTSYHAGLILKYFIENIVKEPVYSFISSEYRLPLNLVEENDVIIAISQSGETIDTIKATREFKKKGARLLSITNVLGSALDRDSDLTLPMRAGPEIGVAATKTFLTQVMTGELLAINMARSAGVLSDMEADALIRELSRAPSMISQSIVQTEKWSKRTSEYLRTKSNAYFLARGLGVPLAMEAALKVKEISYIHAEAYPAGESKHGPIAVVERGFPVFFLVTRDSLEEIQGNIAEMKARGATTFVLTSVNSDKLSISDQLLVLPEGTSLIEPFVLTPPFQLLSYYTAVALGYDPDKPRNLAKTVTVE